MDVLLVAVSLQITAGTAAFAFSRWQHLATMLGAGGAFAGSLLGLFPTLRVLMGGSPQSLWHTWDTAHGAFHVEIDPLSGFFLLPVFALSALAAVYGGSYLLASRRTNIGSSWFFFNLFVGGMAMVLIARTAVLFLVAWEVMSVAAYFLVTFEQEKTEVQQAGWIYLVAAHIGVAFLFLAFVLLGRYAGSLDFANLASLPSPDGSWTGVVFMLGLVGFGTKAGLVPFHVWLPEAHPAAPSHVSALMSGVMIKIGLYGILRLLTFLGPPQMWWGPTLAGLGLVTAVVGIALACHQRDLKRVLAYSSIENIGLIALSLGMALWGLAGGKPELAVLGMTAGLLHIWNHALMKGLMFFTAGSVLHATGTKDMEKLGGLMRKMPWTASAMVVGAVAISALPPLNGFVSKWLMYMGLMRYGIAIHDIRGLTFLFAVGFLALVGSLAAVTFVRLTGIALLGSPRTEAACDAHESSPWLLGPMFVLIVLCMGVAVNPTVVTGWMIGPLGQILGGDAGQALLDLESSDAPLHILGNINAWALCVLAGGMLVLLALTRTAPRTEMPTWGCGYVQPTVRMQYTGRSFAEIVGERLLPRFLRPRTRRLAPYGLFPTKSDFMATGGDPVGEKVYEPFFRRWANRFTRLRILQQGKIHVYLVYIVLTVVAALAWVSLRGWWAAS
jgi:formate hydrogenlyase subunit 3/multisubunit Na+/H+ antiporter MnhD subunit